MAMTREVFVVGVGYTKIDRHFWKGDRELFAEAAWKAIEDSGNVLPKAIVVGNMTSSSLSEQDNFGALVADYAGLSGRPAFKVEAACGSGGAAFYAAYALVASGLVDVCLAGGVEKLTEQPTRRVTRALAYAAEEEYEVYYGASFTSLNALIMRLYMEKFSVTREEMSEWPVLMHENGSQNPYAQLRFKITKDQVANSMIIADPIRLLDASPIGDGAAAVMIASEEVARKITDTPVKVVGLGLATDNMYIASREDLTVLKATRKACEDALKMAKIEPRNIDVAEVHDAFSIVGVLDMEDLGFAEKGMGAKLLAEGRFRIGDKPVINPSGGLKSRGHPVGATGIYQIAEITMQLRGDFPGLKVNGAEIGLAQNVGGVGNTVSVVILRR